VIEQAAAMLRGYSDCRFVDSRISILGRNVTVDLVASQGDRCKITYVSCHSWNMLYGERFLFRLKEFASPLYGCLFSGPSPINVVSIRGKLTSLLISVRDLNSKRNRNRQNNSLNFFTELTSLFWLKPRTFAVFSVRLEGLEPPTF
jgi:hypothetical protein